MTPEDKIRIIARIIFSEAATECSVRDRKLVADTMLNRTVHPGFNAFDLYEVATQGAYSAFNDKNNRNWSLSEKLPFISNLDGIVQININSQNAGKLVEFAWMHASLLASQYWKMQGKSLPSQEDQARMPVYYHDSSISTPCSWDNRWYHAVKLGETEHFLYYAAVPTNQEASR